MPPASKIRFRGAVFALAAAFLWGLVPLYIDLVDATSPYEIVAHRALWSGVLLLCYMLLTDGVRRLPEIFGDNTTRRGLVASSFLLTTNWGLFVYAVQSGRAIEAALGYFIYPLVAVVLGNLLLREHLDRLGWVAISIVVCGVLAKILLNGNPPFIGLCLAVTFGFYGLTRKKMGIDPIMGMFIETIIIMPFAAGYLIWMAYFGLQVFYGGGFFNIILAMLAGVITVAPLLLYHIGNRDLPLSVASLLFYVNPTTQLCVGVFIFGGAFTLGDGLAFSLIWAGVLVFFARHQIVRETPASG